MTDGPEEDRDEAQTANTGSMPSAGQEAPRTQEEVSDAMRGLRRAPRRVDILREGGSYTIRFGGRNIASFCHEFSEITGYNIPEDTHQQVYITVEGIGQVRTSPVVAEEEYIRTRGQQDQMQGRPAGLSPPDLSPESLETLLVDIPDRVGRRTLGEILQRQINRARVTVQEDPPIAQYAGALRRSMEHPQPERGGALARSMEQPSEDWRREVYSRLHQEISQCSEMLRLLERL